MHTNQETRSNGLQRRGFQCRSSVSAAPLGLARKREGANRVTVALMTLGEEKLRVFVFGLGYTGLEFARKAQEHLGAEVCPRPPPGAARPGGVRRAGIMAQHADSRGSAPIIDNMRLSFQWPPTAPKVFGTCRTPAKAEMLRQAGIVAFPWDIDEAYEVRCAAIQELGWRVPPVDSAAPESAPLCKQGSGADGLPPPQPLKGDARSALEGATHLLATLGPIADFSQDPVLALNGAALAGCARLRWAGYLSTTSVYGDHQGTPRPVRPAPAPGPGERR